MVYIFIHWASTAEAVCRIVHKNTYQFCSFSEGKLLFSTLIESLPLTREVAKSLILTEGEKTR